MAMVLRVEEFMELVRESKIPIIDSRSEKEFLKAHIPGALNLPLLTNDERAQVGTIYKQKGRTEAVKKGFELVGPRFAAIIANAERMAPEREVLLYCWRGGMRSNIMAWLLQMAGFRITLLNGGYKAFRQWTLERFNQQGNILVLGGRTGSGKTQLLKALQQSNEAVIDLEGLAHHKGSAFGALGQEPQTSNEHFENELALLWHSLQNKPVVWLENESRSIGSNLLPLGLYEQMRQAPVIELVLDDAIRKKRILSEYGHFSTEDLADNTKKIAKRLGGKRLKEALAFLEQGDLSGWVEIMMEYYDQAYQHGIGQRNQILVFPMKFNHDRIEEMLPVVLDQARSVMGKQEVKTDD